MEGCFAPRARPADASVTTLETSPRSGGAFVSPTRKTPQSPLLRHRPVQARSPHPTPEIATSGPRRAIADLVEGAWEAGEA